MKAGDKDGISSNLYGFKSSSGTIVDKFLKNKNLTAAVKYIFLAFLNICLSLSQIYGMRPFGAGLFLAFIFMELPLYFCIPVFMGAEIIADPTLNTFLFSVVCATTAVLYRVFFTKIKARRELVLALTAFVSQLGLAFYLRTQDITWPLFFISALLTVVFTIACLCAARPVLKEKLKYRLLETEIICLCIVLTAAASGLSRLNIYQFEPLLLVASFTILLAARLNGAGSALACAFCFGLGRALYSYSPENVACFVFMAALCAIFSNAHKAMAFISIVAAYVMFTFYFSTEYTGRGLDILSVALGAGAFTLIPSKIYSNIKEFYFASNERAAVRFMISKFKADTGTALLNNADIFDSMSSYISRDNTESPGREGKLFETCCSQCDNLALCSKPGFKDELNAILKTAEQKGRVTVSEIPYLISCSCIRLSKLVKAATEIDDKYRIVKNKNAYEAEARNIVSSQLAGVAKGLRAIAQRHGDAPVFNKEKEKILIEELNYSGVSCCECVIAGESISIIVRTECVDRAVIEKAASKILRQGYAITGIDDTVLAGFCAVVLSPLPKYNMVFGIAGRAKKENEKSGDTHSFIKLDNSRLLIALCDGMGSGDKAEKISETSISLIESFYKAGFSNELALYSVNRFLSLTSGESFSALDICVIDLETARADIIKLGSPAAYIKKKDVIQRIDSQSLPLGADENVRPSIITVDLDAGDTLVLTSDGISDCFDGDKLAASVLNINSINPQTIAQCVMEKTLDICHNSVKDDATVIAARLIRR